MAAAWLYKVRTGSGSDRVVSEMLDYGVAKSCLTGEKTKRLRMRFDPVATTPGSDFGVAAQCPLAFSHSLYREVVPHITATRKIEQQ